MFGGVASGGTVEIGTHSRVGGASAIGQATLRNRSEVHGALIAAKVVKEGSVVAPPTVTKPVGASSKVSWNVTFPASSGGSVRVAPGGDRTLDPGRYGDVDVESQGTLRLRAGAYYLDSLETDDRAAIQLDSSGGTVVIYVRIRLDHQGTMMASPRAGDVLIGYFGTSEVAVQSGFAGWLVAPYAEVDLQPGAVAQGAFFASRLEVKPNVTIQRADLSRSGPGWVTINPVQTPGNGTVAPPPPTAAGLSPAQYRDAVLSYFTNLYNQGYDGPPIVVEAHPDDTDAQPVTAAIQTAAPGPTPSPAAGSAPATVAGGKPAIVAQFPRLDPAFVDPTPPTPPKTCPLGLGAGLPSPLPPPGGTPPSVNQPFSVGEPRDDSKDFDAFFGVTGNTDYGVNPSDGFFAGVTGDFDAGIRMFGITADFLSAHVDGDIATNRSPHAEGKAGVQILGANFGA